MRTLVLLKDLQFEKGVNNIKRIIYSILIFIVLSVSCIFLANLLDVYFTTKAFARPPGFAECIERIITNAKCQKMYLLCEGVALIIALLFYFSEKSDYYKAGLLKVTDNISIPVAAGQGQHGTARLMTDNEKKKHFGSYKISIDNAYFADVRAAARSERKLVEATMEENPNAVSKDEKKRWKRDERRLRQGKIIKTDEQKIFLSQRIKWKVEDFTLRCGLKSKKKPEVRHDVAPEKPPLLKSAGLVVSMEKTRNGTEKIYCITDDLHSLIVGATRCGKSRCLVIQTICSLALAGESIVATDPKGELYAYTRRYLEQMGYEIVVLDFQNPELSGRYNPLQQIIDAVNEGNMTSAQSRTWDLVSFLVEKNERSEPLWSNGEMSVLAASILCVVVDNKDHPEFQNMTNVYWFISEMCKDVKLPMSPSGATFKPISKYIHSLPDTHPAKALLGIADVAPSRTAGSFYTSAMSTLRLFVSDEIYGITCDSDFKFEELGKKKRALFFVLPDQKTTYYPIVTLYVAQIYDTLVDEAKRNGNRLNNRVNFVLDEFGNFTKITDFQTKLTVGGGYGLRFNLFLQDFNQLIDKYGKEVANIVKGNCSAWVYLASNDEETRTEFQKRLGEYTTTSYSLGSSSQRRSNSSSSSNVNLISRALLTAEEIGKIARPYVLISVSGKYPIVTQAPDLSKWGYNELLALGDRDYNKAFIKYNTDKRAENKRPAAEIKLWGIWNKYNKQIC